MKSTINEFRKFLRHHGISQSFAAAELGVSQPVLNQLMRGRAVKISGDRLESVIAAMDSWMERMLAEEHKLYLKLLPIVREAQPMAAKSVLNHLYNDVNVL